jgi:tripartite-type tricarboxylate transporter receptor subunit TctC
VVADHQGRRDQGAVNNRTDRFLDLAPTDDQLLARIYAEKLSHRLHASFVVSNRQGAGGIIAGQAVATAAPDGYALLFANSGHVILGALNKHPPFDRSGASPPLG